MPVDVRGEKGGGVEIGGGGRGEMVEMVGRGKGGEGGMGRRGLGIQRSWFLPIYLFISRIWKIKS